MGQFARGSASKALAASFGLEAGDDLEIVEASKGRIAVLKLIGAPKRSRAWIVLAGYRFNREEADER